MKLHTTPNKVQELLGLKCSFNNDTLPSLNTVNGWIQDVTSELNEYTANKYSSNEVVDVLDFNGEDFLLTSKSPVSNVVVEVDTSREHEEPVWEELDLYTNYLVEEAKGRITFTRLTSRSLRSAKQKFRVTYNSGTGEVPYWLRNLATRMVALRVMNAALNNRVVNSEDASQIRVGQVQVIKPSDFGIGNYDSLKGTIDRDLDELRSSVRGVRYVNY